MIKTAKRLKPLKPGDSIRYLKEGKWEPAIVKEKHEAPRSCNIMTEHGKELRRNRVHLQKTAEPVPEVIPDFDYDSLFSKEQNIEKNGRDILTYRPRDTLKKPVRFRDTYANQ